MKVNDYQCSCHVGECPLHRRNQARNQFRDALCNALGFDRTKEDYGSDRHNQARRILHLADYYVQQVVKEKRIRG